MVQNAKTNAMCYQISPDINYINNFCLKFIFKIDEDIAIQNFNFVMLSSAMKYCARATNLW